MSEFKQTKINQKGFASMVIALILILVLGLITLSFSQLSRREQKGTLDKLLATQAYYAAETGINEIDKKIVQQAAGFDTLTTESFSQNTCLTEAQMTSKGIKPVIDKNSGVTFTCAILNLTPPSLEYSGIEPDAEKAGTFFADDSTQGLGSFTVSWNSGSNRTSIPASTPTFFPAKASWNYPAVLEVSLTRIPNTSSFGRAELMNNTFTVFLVPGVSASSSVAFAPTNNAQVINADCATGRDYLCNSTITSIGGAVDQKYLIRIRSLYDKSNISIGSAKGTDGTTALKFKRGQAMIDVTGRARDVVRRIRVRAPIDTIPKFPNYTIEAQNICKRFTSQPQSGDDQAKDSPDTNPAFLGSCDLN